MGIASVRPPAVAGLFYPGDPRELDAMLEHLFARTGNGAFTVCPKAIIVPHAGYIYSGQTAAQAFARLKPWAATLSRVVILGPTHRVPLHGIALPASDGFATPFGTVEVDRGALAKVRALPGVCVYDAAHAGEHSLEVQLPFLQLVLDHFKVVPLAVGRADSQSVATVIEQLWGGPETLFVVSTDLSHFHAYREAQELDSETVRRILALEHDIDPELACGAYPLNGLMRIAEQHGMSTLLLEQCNSGDTAGDRRRVVGYCSVALFEPTRHAH
ncbi:AmmeMemoRadiSam system protein B [Niveibacterium umoris]|uniref:MEMO1 family protein GGR36_000770 n=1 Tax=Niveibacterium umoris TaxID=1193620 RepID=A0A840BIQ4_9RHOO|nr:AmmeMemoRadiSam system protein B [Niveibacterium umoris]MBB4011462.1 hypothetical protein [Niveibacterium umoris]